MSSSSVAKLSESLHAYIGFIATDRKTGKKIYCDTTEFHIFFKTANFVFHPQNQITPTMKYILGTGELKEEDHESMYSVNHLILEPDQFENKKMRVQRISINFYGPSLSLSMDGTIQDCDWSWAAVILGIGKICRRIFPNLKPEESSFNVHFGTQHYRCDGVLHPCDRIDLFPK